MSSFLPIGSVCKLEDDEFETMVCGYCYFNEDEKYDYIGLIFPAGLRSEDSFIGFNESQIKEVIFRGYDTDEYKNFIRSIKKELAKDETEKDNFSIEDIENRVIEQIQNLKGE